MSSAGNALRYASEMGCETVAMLISHMRKSLSSSVAILMTNSTIPAAPASEVEQAESGRQSERGEEDMVRGRRKGEEERCSSRRRKRRRRM